MSLPFLCVNPGKHDRRHVSISFLIARADMRGAMTDVFVFLHEFLSSNVRSTRNHASLPDQEEADRRMIQRVG